jgi:phenylalanyl-tRNA synthetase beta chain
LEDPTLCPRYIAAYIKGVKVGPSPEWLKRNLESVGQRSINNVVDATNFVMFNTGQPLHAFDAGRLVQKEGKYLIVVRKARAGEKLLALDTKEYELADSMLIIADGNADVPVGIAGIKGGTPAGITEATTDIIIESANFDSVSVRKTAQMLKLRTDASSRFEQKLSPELAMHGMRGMLEFIQHIIGGELAGITDVYPAPQEPVRVSVSIKKINQVLGTGLTGAEVADAFVRLGFEYKEEGGVFDAAVPAERLDITIPEDLVEEVGRIVGYEHVPATPLSPMPTPPEANTNFEAAQFTRRKFAAQGYTEVFTSVFAEKGERLVLNKADGVRPYLRTNLTDGLTEALKKNIPYKDLLGLAEIKLFEIGTVWKGGEERTMVGMASEKEGVKEGPFSTDYPMTEDVPPLAPPALGRYQPFSKYPYIVRDIAMWAPAGTQTNDVLEMIKSEAGDPPAGGVLQTVRLFDQFQKGERTSLAFRLIFQSFGKTLTEVEVNQVMEKMSQTLKQKGFEIR